MPHSPSIIAARALADRLAAEHVGSETVRACMTEAYDGDDATGAWIWRQAYDAVEAAVVLFLRRYGRAMRQTADGDAVMLGMIERVALRLPSFTRRSTEQVELQQFSTPPALAFLVAAAAKIQPGDVVLEPSAGTGLLAIMAEIAGSALILNELGDDRAALLEALWPNASVTRFNAEHIHDRLDRTLSPNVVIMNPPFSTSPDVRAHRSIVTERHVGAGLRRLAQGGRLVTITSAGFEPAGLADEGVQLVFSSAIDGKVYRRAGTGIATRLTVYDKAAPGREQPPSPWPDPASDPAELLQRLAALPARQPSVGHLPCIAPKASASRASARTLPAAPVVSARFADAEPLDYDVIPDATPIGGRNDRIYEPYGIERLRISGAAHHPTPLVQSAAMASVLPPVVDYRPLLPPAIVRDGLLSHAQLETVILAGAAHAELLP
ncbi:MAG: strawberry notch family protein, partial [Alphaproteobacteria bacterium]|nr:strawberry notch family protein [Alphaproteobacteria bacterium]